MFISEEEANKRINSSRNVLRIIRKEDSPCEMVHEDVPSIEPDEILPPSPSEPAPLSAAPSAAPSEVSRWTPEVRKIATGVYPELPVERAVRKLLGLGCGGRQEGKANLPVEVQAAVSVCAQLVGTETAARTFETSYHHADELKHGYTSQQARYGGEDPHEGLERIITQQKKSVRDLAFEKLTKSLGLISDDKLTAVNDALKLARISRDLSAVVEKVLPKEQVQMGGVHFHVWRPEMREEESYEIVSVGNIS